MAGESSGGSINNSLTVSNSVISSNSATGVGTFGGGGICYTGGNLTITGTTFSNNSTSTSGGAVSYSAGDPAGRFPSPGTLTVSGSTFSSNTANSASAGGGALDLYDFNLSSGVYTINTSSFSGNTAPNGSGGAIIVESGGPLTVTTSSFATNSAGNSGGAIFSSGTVVTVTYSRLVGNNCSEWASTLPLAQAHLPQTMTGGESIVARLPEILATLPAMSLRLHGCSFARARIRIRYASVVRRTSRPTSSKEMRGRL